MITTREPYAHVQQAPKSLFGIPIIVFIIVLMVLAVARTPVAWSTWPIVLLSIGIAAASIFVFSRMVVEVRDGVIRWTFGFGFPGYSLPLSEVQSAVAVRNPWIFGLGIHFIPRGIIYNVWATAAVEITKKNGRRIRLGTDEPEALVAAILANR
jgi:hypothetical protein